MKDSLPNKTYYYLKPLAQELDSVRKDIKGIYTEIKDYNKQQKEKPDVSSDTIYTVKVTLIVFILGILIDRGWKAIDRKLKEADTKKFFMFHLKQVNENLVTKLKDAYKEYSEGTTIDTGITSTPPKVISSDFQRLLQINHEELFKAYKKQDVLSKIMGQIELLKIVQIEVDEFHERVRIDSDIVRDNLERQSDEYLSVLSEYIEWEKQNNVGYEKSDTFKLINSLVIKYYKELSGTRQLSVFYNDIIRVIQKHIVETNEYKTHHILGGVAERGRKLSHLISKLAAKTKEIVDQYKAYADYMESAFTALNKLIPELK